jgi:hypothetical protein
MAEELRVIPSVNAASLCQRCVYLLPLILSNAVHLRIGLLFLFSRFHLIAYQNLSLPTHLNSSQFATVLAAPPHSLLRRRS